MICEICHKDSGGQRFCAACILAFQSALAKQRVSTTVRKYIPKTYAMTQEYKHKTTHYRVQYKSFCCYVDVRDCASMDEAPAYALNRENNIPWYPVWEHIPPLPENIPYVLAVDHSKFADWLRNKEEKKL